MGGDERDNKDVNEVEYKYKEQTQLAASGTATGVQHLVSDGNTEGGSWPQGEKDEEKEHKNEVNEEEHTEQASLAASRSSLVDTVESAALLMGDVCNVSATGLDEELVSS